MASSREEPSTSGTSAIECSICYSCYTSTPKSLSCGHTFCLDCLKGLSNSQQNRFTGSLSCPTCRAPCVIPRGGLEALATNYSLLTIIEQSKCAALSCTRTTFDGTCQLSPCQHCRKRFCEECLAKHRQALSNELKQQIKNVQQSAEAIGGNGGNISQSIVQQLNESIYSFRAKLDKDERKRFEAACKAAYDARMTSMLEQCQKTNMVRMDKVREANAGLEGCWDLLSRGFEIPTKPSKEEYDKLVSRIESCEKNLGMLKKLAAECDFKLSPIDDQKLSQAFARVVDEILPMPGSETSEQAMHRKNVSNSNMTSSSGSPSMACCLFDLTGREGGGRLECYRECLTCFWEKSPFLICTFCAELHHSGHTLRQAIDVSSTVSVRRVCICGIFLHKAVQSLCTRVLAKETGMNSLFIGQPVFTCVDCIIPPQQQATRQLNNLMVDPGFQLIDSLYGIRQILQQQQSQENVSNAGLCLACCRRCHAGHRVKLLLPYHPAFFCDCGLPNVCRIECKAQTF